MIVWHQVHQQNKDICVRRPDVYFSEGALLNAEEDVQRDKCISLLLRVFLSGPPWVDTLGNCVIHHNDLDSLSFEMLQQAMGKMTRKAVLRWCACQQLLHWDSTDRHAIMYIMASTPNSVRHGSFTPSLLFQATFNVSIKYDSGKVWSSVYQPVKGNLILGQPDKATMSFEVLDFLFKVLICEERCEGYVWLRYNKGIIFESRPRHWVICLELIHLCQIKTHKSRIVEEVSCEEIRNLIVQSSEISRPVTLTTWGNDLQQWLNLLQILVKELCKFTSGFALFPLNVTCIVTFQILIDLNHPRVIVMQCLSQLSAL